MSSVWQLPQIEEREMVNYDMEEKQQESKEKEASYDSQLLAGDFELSRTSHESWSFPIYPLILHIFISFIFANILIIA